MGLLQHGRYLSEKASADVYVMDAFVGFDKFARSVANRKGPSAFGKISDLNKNRFFSLENYKDVRALKSRGINPRIRSRESAAASPEKMVVGRKVALTIISFWLVRDQIIMFSTALS